MLFAKSDATQHFKILEHRFERAIDALEHGRELVQGSFDLYATSVAENTNTLVRRITFASIILGAIGAVAGVFGMNFQTPYTASGITGFWLVVGTLRSRYKSGGSKPASKLDLTIQRWATIFMNRFAASARSRFRFG